MEVTRRPQASRTTPILLAVTPLPSPLTTPPVTNTYFIPLPPKEKMLSDGLGFGILSYKSLAHVFYSQEQPIVSSHVYHTLLFFLFVIYFDKSHAWPVFYFSLTNHSTLIKKYAWIYNFFYYKPINFNFFYYNVWVPNNVFISDSNTWSNKKTRRSLHNSSIVYVSIYNLLILLFS